MHTTSHHAGAPDLPVQLTSFVGREREIAAIRQAIGNARLLTLTGAGGSGKTRLALQVASQVEADFSEGVVWVEFAALTDPRLLPQQVTTVLGIRDEAGRSATAVLLDALRHRSLLLILDNCEHLADACAALVDTLLRGCPGVRILATSREALGVAGERAWLVPPLSLPPADTDLTPESSMRCEAVQLFVARAQDAVPGFVLKRTNAAAVAHVCRRLDGLPLAIELAAARVKVLTPEQIAQRLDNAFALLTGGSRTALPRHRTLRAAVDWSYRLLSASEQVLLQRLSVFPGDFTLEAVEAICTDGDLEAWEVLELLARLVDRSLVVMREHVGFARYHLLETVRQYASERLRQPDGNGVKRACSAGQVERRHALYYADLAERAAEQLRRPGQLESLAVLELEHDNLRGVLAWSLKGPDAELALRLCLALREFWRMHGHLSEGRRWMREALALSPTADALRARVLVGAADLARLQGDHALARERLTEAEALARRVGDGTALAQALTSLGVQLVLQRDLPAARERFDEAIALHRELAASWGLTIALGGRASVALAEGDLALARALRAEAAEVSRRAGDREGEAHALLGLGELARQQDDYASAGSAYERSLTLLRELGEPYHIAVALHDLAWVAINTGRLDEALQLLAEDLHLEIAVGSRDGPAFSVAGLAAVLLARGHGQFAALALAAAYRQLAAVGINPPPADAREWERLRATLRSTLGEELFQRAWSTAADQTFSAVLERVVKVLDLAAPADASARSVGSATAEPLPLPQPARSAPVAPPPGLRVLALGPLEIYREGELLSPELWRYAKPKELLLYLLSHPEGRTREQIGLVFWPESSAVQVKNSFHVTLHHLRKALGRHDWVVLEDERYRINPALGCELDATSFQEQITTALRGARGGEGSADRLRAALALYRGDFLQDETVGDWHLEIRDHLRRLYVDGLFALGELLMQAEAFAEAAAVYQQLVRKEDLHEEAHRRLMLCLARTGERGRALRHYERLVVLLREGLDAEPEEQTTGLYERLKKAQTV
jgi:predicted ATPase/DNA-binding SARP family transcriptional activator